MPLQLVSPPPAVWSAYEKALLDFLGPHAPEVKFFHVPVGTLGLEDLVKGGGLDDIVPSGSRVFAAWPDGTVTSSEMTDATPHAGPEFRSYVQGGLVAMVFARIAEAQGLAPVQTLDVELHFLSIPGIHFEALHLVSHEPSSDLILPLLCWDSQFAIDAVLDAATFLAQARAIASARVALATSSPLSS
jgi:hypothetical protein